ncbi:Centrosome-associated protein [Armadillidium nasatum]|uniref:Centrosome-associated protein n=1 Tax=Armadillidium nasatum TaxID=96803 RepID=A0A5N5SKG6_9CRUS|nr:Centrosome-associated protein [Armadillidium nasatum]
MFRERINFEKEENEKYKSKRHPFRSSELQKGSKEGNIKHRDLDSVSEKTSTISNPSSSSEKCINFSKEKKIQSLHEMAMRLTKTLAEEEEALDEKLKSLKSKSSSHNEKKNSKENKILTKVTDSDNLSVEEVIEKLKNILPDPKVKPMSVTNHFLTNKNNIFVNEANNDLALRFYKSERDVMGITQLGLSSDPVKFSGLRALNVPHFLNSVQSPIFLSKKHMSNLFRGVKNQYSPEQIKAATIIQAYYRGYQVRKITSLLLKKAGSKGHGHKRLKVHPHKDIPISQNIKSYNNNSAVLPKHLKPFYNLAETGDINTFTDSYLKTKTQNYVVKESQKLNKHSEEKSLKVPISIPSLERSFMKNDNINSMFISRDLGQSIKKDSNISDEVDLKNFCTNKILKHNVCSEDKSNIYSLRSVNNFKNRDDRKDDDHASYHISNGLSQNDIIHGSYTTISSVSCSSSNATDISSSIYSFSHHKLLDDKGKRSIPVKASNTLVISPSHLRSKINAELVFQDTIGSALNHLQDLQNIKAISKAQDLTVNHPKLQDKCLNTENYGYTEESQSSLYKKKFQDDIKKMEREAQERIAKLEQDLKDKVEKMFDSASKGGTSKPDSRTCDSLSKNKYSIDHTDEDSSSVSQESAKSLKKFMKLSTYDNQLGSSGKSDHSLHSVNSSSDAVLVTDVEDFSSKENALKSKHHIIQSSNIQMDDMPKKQANLNDSSDMCDLKIYKNKTSIKSKYLQKVATETCDKQNHTSGLLKSHVSTNQVQEKVPDSLSSINKDIDAQIFPKSDFTHPGFSSEHNPNENAIAQNVKSIDKDTDSKTLNQKESIYNSHRNAEILLESETFSKINEEKITAPVTYDSNPKYSKIRDESFSTYSEPFDSGGNNADLSLDPEEKSLLSSAEQKDTSFHSTQKYKEKLNDVNQDTFKSVRGGALQSMLNLLLSLQKEEEIRFKHQLAVFKLQEQFLIEEARLKLISANSEGGINLRKRQRAIFLQLREQRSHIKRLIETQKLAAQQRQMFFNQHYNLLLSTSNSGNRGTPSRTHSPLPNNVEFSSSDGFENSSSTSSFSKGLRKIGQHYSLLKEDSSYKNKNDLLSSGIKEDSKPNLPIKKDMSKRRDESLKNDNLRTLNQDKTYVMKTDESDTSELEASRNFVPKRISYPNVNISSKEQKIKDNLLKEPDLNSNFSNTHESRSQIQVVAETRYLSNHRTAKTNIEFDLAHSNIKGSEKIKSSKETIVSEKICDVKSNILEEKTRRQSGGLPFALRYPLSPRSSIYYRRQSSESDDSFNLSQNDTISDISDYEGRLVALREELVLRKTEAERLKKERRRIIKERISSQEQALRNQIAVYDNFIEQKKQEIDIESQKLLKVTSVKPLIKKPQASSTKAHHSESPSVNESVCNENLIDESLISDNTSTNISNEKAVLVKTLDDSDIATVDVNKELEETSITLVKDNEWLRKKANNLADYILDSLVSDSILCMRRLLRNKNKSQVIIFDIISQSDDPLVGCEALDKDFEAFVKTKTTVQNDVSSLDANYIPVAVESLPCEQNILEKSDDDG